MSGWRAIADFREISTGREGMVVATLGDRAGARIGHLVDGVWWGGDGFRLAPQPTHCLPHVIIPALPAGART